MSDWPTGDALECAPLKVVIVRTGKIDEVRVLEERGATAVARANAMCVFFFLCLIISAYTFRG